MLDFRSFKVSVRVNNENLPVFQPEYDEDSKTATGWIASEEGQTFSVYVKQDNDDAYLDQPLGLKAPGTIRVEMYRIRVTGQGPYAWRGANVDDAPIVVHEKSKKAGGHVTRLGNREPSQKRSRYLHSAPYSPSDKDPWAVFEFRYRPAAILQAEGIMPRAHRPAHGEAEEQMEAQYKAELRALEDEQAALDARRAALTARVGNPTVKRESSPIRVPPDAVVEVIDLTLE
ncbi:hypothetical protein FRB90_011221 [Tulasnella sp. 427]|nr:hypothetical protein FRB90_011221 [Tulasnella sp. 427]